MNQHDGYYRCVRLAPGAGCPVGMLLDHTAGLPTGPWCVYVREMSRNARSSERLSTSAVEILLSQISHLHSSLIFQALVGIFMLFRIYCPW